MKTPKAAILLCILTMPLQADDQQGRPPGIPQPRAHQQPDKTNKQKPERPDRPENGSMEAPEPRTIDGFGNHFGLPEIGTPDEPMVRLFPADYEDGISLPSGGDRPSAREISNLVASQTTDLPNRRGASDFLWQWGQFIDHDIDETPTIDPEEPFDIVVPTGDPWFDPTSSGTATIPLNRSYYDSSSGVREQINGITAYIDASQVYGSDDVRAYNLRKLDGSGELKSSASNHGDLLPYNESGEENAPSTTREWFLAGDIRANEQAALTAMHTLFMREHNYWARHFRESNPAAAEDTVYEYARMIVGAEMQHITYSEFLPVLLGPKALPPYLGFKEEANPTIANEFATAAFRLGHSLLSPVIRRIDATGQTAASGDLALANAFFDPSIVASDGIENLLRGLASQRCQELDGKIVDALRNFLFGAPGSGGLDLASLNIQRGRDHGLPSYNEARRQLGMRPARNFRDINPDPEVQQALSDAYSDVDDIDLWVGGLAEPHVRGAMVGPVFHRIISRQFANLRDGDRFYYEASLPREILDSVREQSLATIIRRNTSIGDELRDDVFVLPGDFGEDGAAPSGGGGFGNPKRPANKRREDGRRPKH